MTERFNIFRVYQENHPESLDFKPPVRQSEPEIDFAPKTVLEITTPTVSKPDSIVPLIDETAGQLDAQEEINRVTDINEMIRIGNFPAAEYLLGRKLTMDELREKMVRDLLKAPEKLEQQLRAEIMREKKKAEILKKMQDEEAQKNALSNPAPIGPFPQPPIVVPGNIVASGPPPPPPRPPRPGFAPLQPQPPPSPPHTPPRPQRFLPKPLGPGPGTPLTMPGSPVVSRPPSPTPSVQSVMSSTTKDMLDLLNKMPNAPVSKVMDLRHRLLALSIDDDDIVDAIEENLADFQKRLDALGTPATIQRDVVKERTQVRELLGRPDSASSSSAPPAPVPLRPNKEPLDFVFKDDDGTSRIFHPDKDKPNYMTKPKMTMVKSQMLLAYPQLNLDTGAFNGLTQKSNVDVWYAAIKKANEAIVEENKKKLAGQPTVGTGIRQKKMRADWGKFGERFLINMDKFKRGIFALGYATTRQPPHWARGGIELTKPLKSVIQAFLDGEPLDLSELNEQEKAWITHIWTNAKIVKGKVPSYGMMKTKQLKTKQDMIDRIDVLLGIQAAGNDSPLILKELRELKEKMYDRGWISAADLKKLEQLIALGA